MAESEAVQTAIMQTAIQAATAEVMMLRKEDSGLTSGTSTANVGEAHRHKHDRPVLREPFFNRKVTEKYAELLSFETEVTSIPYHKKAG